MREIPVSEAEARAMRRALELARAAGVAGVAGEIPVGAVVIGSDGEVLATGVNTREATGDPAGHAEINAMRDAIAVLRARDNAERLLTGATLVVTLEPCVMCATAILMMRPARVVFGAWDDKAGGAGGAYDILRDGLLPHPVPEVAGGVFAEESAQLLADFFASRRTN